jgi:hypothetical protein
MGGRIAIFMALILGCSLSYAKEIPLSEIWAYDMPGTKDVRKLGQSESIERILRAIAHKSNSQEFASPGFAIVGTNKTALDEAFQVLVKRQSAPDKLSPSEPVSIVVFSHNTVRYFHISSVETRGVKFIVRYQLIPHKTKKVTSHFAIIPLGKLTPDKYQVEMVQLQPVEFIKNGFPPISDEVAKTIVSNSFDFEIEELGDRK